MGTHQQKTVRELIAELGGTKCRCGKTKESRRTFCRHCYFALPEKLRTDLYKRVGEGYEQAYAEAVEILDGQAATG